MGAASTQPRGLWLSKARHDGRNMYKNFGNIDDVKSIGWHCPMLPSEACIGIELLFNKNLMKTNIGNNYKNYKKINSKIFNN